MLRQTTVTRGRILPYYASPARHAEELYFLIARSVGSHGRFVIRWEDDKVDIKRSEV